MKERMNFGKFLIRLCTPLAHLIFPFKTLGHLLSYALTIHLMNVIC